MHGILGKKTSLRLALIRLTLPCVAISAFLNNTPIGKEERRAVGRHATRRASKSEEKRHSKQQHSNSPSSLITLSFSSLFSLSSSSVAMLIPITISWAARAGVDARKLLIPMAYAVTFGGTITLIGTSTNLVVTGKERERDGKLNPHARARPRPPLSSFPAPSSLTRPSLPSLFSLSHHLGLQEKRYAKDPAKARYGFFEITPYGITYAVAGLLYLWLAAPGLLPGASGRTPEEKAAAAAAKSLQGGGEFSDAEGKAGAGAVPTIPEDGPAGGAAGAFAFKGRPFFAVRVTPGSPVAGASVRVAGLKGLDSLFLVATGRGGVLTHAVSPDSLLQEGDILYFSGDVRAAVGELAGKGLELLPANADATGGSKGGAGGGYEPASAAPLRLVSADGSAGAGVDAAEAGAPAALLPGGIKLLTAAVRKGGALDGVTVRESGIGARFGADIVSLTRYGSEQRPGRLADVRLRAGDQGVLAVPAPYEHKGDRAFAAAFSEAAPLAEGAERQVRKRERERETKWRRSGRPVPISQPASSPSLFPFLI